MLSIKGWKQVREISWRWFAGADNFTFFWILLHGLSDGQCSWKFDQLIRYMKFIVNLAQVHTITTNYTFPNMFTVLSSGSSSANANNNETLLDLCGANYCPSTGNGSNADPSGKPSMDKIYTMAGIFLAFALAAPILNAIFVDPLTRLVTRQTSQFLTLTHNNYCPNL